MNKNNYYKEIYNRFGPVTRARNCFLYTKKGTRLTDLYQENGRAILGWDAGNAFTFLKNTISRGQVGSFITEDKERLVTAVSKLLESDRKLYYFNTKSDAVKTALLFSPESTSLYKPWNPEPTNWAEVDSVVIVPPLPWTDTIYITAIKTEIANTIQEENNIIQNNVKLPFALENALARGIYNLIAEIPLREEKNWFIYDPIITKYWLRKGPYLYPKIQEKDYDAFVLHCLDCELAISPSYNTVSIIPFGADKGVFTKLKNNPFIPTI